jgi:hypothetical protein
LQWDSNAGLPTGRVDRLQDRASKCREIAKDVMVGIDEHYVMADQLESLMAGQMLNVVAPL